MTRHDAPVFYGHVELRDGPDYGRVAGEWQSPRRIALGLMWDVLCLVGAAIALIVFGYCAFLLVWTLAQRAGVL